MCAIKKSLLNSLAKKKESLNTIFELVGYRYGGIRKIAARDSAFSLRVSNCNYAKI